MIGLSKTKIKLFIEYCITILIILCNYCMYARIIDSKLNQNNLLEILGLVCLLRVLVESVNFKIVLRKKYIVCILFVIICSLLSVVVPLFNVQYGLLLYAFPMTSFILMFSICLNIRSVWNCFVNTMFIIAVVALFFYLFGSTLNIIQPTGVVQYTYNSATRSCNSYYNLYFESQVFKELGFLNMSIRNCGIFIEAPMYNIMLCLALVAELSFRNNIRKRVVVILAVSIITTMTTTGILVLVSTLVIKSLGGEKKSFLKTFRVIIFPIMILIAAFMIIEVMNNKLSAEQGEASYSVRLDHTVAFFKMFLHSPLFGYGFGNSEVFYSFAEYDQGYSVGLPALLGRCGGLIFSLYIVPWIKLTIHSFKEKRFLYFYIGSFIGLFLTAVVYNPIMYMIICAQLVEAADLKSTIHEERRRKTLGEMSYFQDIQNIRE